MNLGDAMVEWTGGVLRSNLHRINFSPGEQRFKERYSVVLLNRPYYEADMRRMEGGRIPAVEVEEELGLEEKGGMGRVTMREWELRKMAALKEGRDCAASRGGGVPMRGGEVAVEG